MTEFVTIFKVTNKNAVNIRLILEPWAEEFTIPVNSTLSIEIFHDTHGLIQTETNPSFFIVWLWHGCRAKVLLDGIDQTPPSLSIASF